MLHFLYHAVPNPQSVAVTADPPNPVLNGSTVAVNCTVVLHEITTADDLPLLNVSAQISRNGNVLMQTSQSLDGTTYNFGATVNCFCESDVGNYTCTATVTPLPSSNHLTGMGQQESLSYVILIGKYMHDDCV